MYDIEKKVKECYGVEVKNIIANRDYYIINTSQGKKVLQRCMLRPDRIRFIHGAKEHLYKNGFANTDRYNCNQDGEPFGFLDGECYTLSNAVDGRECNFDNRSDVLAASRSLAMLHKASRGYIPPENCQIQDDLGKIPAYFTKRLEELKKLRKIAGKRKSDFDYLFLKYYDYFYGIGEKVIEDISNSCYESLVDSVRKERSFCHHDYTHHNIIMDGGRTHVINFHYCRYELRVYDIANFLRRKMRKCNWSVNEAREIIREYNSIDKISEEEFLIMKYMLLFPQKFWRVANRFYNSKRSWSERSFLARLNEVIDEIEPHKKVMENYWQLI